MPQPRHRPSLQDIADKVGCSRSTVSLALRNHLSLPEATRIKIQAAAKSIGYRPNPLVTALMSQLRDRRKTRQERIALVCRLRETMEQRRQIDTFVSALYDSIRLHANEQGFGIDEFYLGRDPIRDSRLSHILVSRGIHGVLFFPGANRPGIEYPELDWRHFATVLIGFNTSRENLHQVAADYTYDIDCALRRVIASGIRRIGFAIPMHASKSTNHAWVSRFLLHQQTLPPADRIPPLLTEADWLLPEVLLPWFHSYRPDLILGTGDTARTILLSERLRIPEDVRLINLTQRGEEGMAGIDPHTGEVGRAAIDLLASLLRANQLGQPEFPRTIAIKGHWSPGASFPE